MLESLIAKWEAQDIVAQVYSGAGALTFVAAVCFFLYINLRDTDYSDLRDAGSGLLFLIAGVLLSCAIAITWPFWWIGGVIALKQRLEYRVRYGR